MSKVSKYIETMNSKSDAKKAQINLNRVKGRGLETFEELLARISKESLNQFYIIDGNSKKDTLKYFNIKDTMLHKILNFYGLSKYGAKANYRDNDLKRLSLKYPKEDLISYYIEENHSLEELTSFLDISNDRVIRLLKFYNISKKGISSLRLSKDELYQLYIVDDLSQIDIAKRFNVSNDIVCNLLKKYNISKPRKSILDSISNSIDKDSFYNYVVVEDHSVKETIEHFDLDPHNNQYSYLCHLWGIKKELSLPLDEKIANISREELYNYYVIEDHSSLEVAKHFKIGKNSVFKILEYFGMPTKLSSKYEKEIENLLPNIKFKRNKRILNGKEIDLYSDVHKIGIEFNGTYWHSTLIQNKNKNYHLEKSKNAQEKGIRLIHIYEYEWKDPLKRPILESMLKTAFNSFESKIYARNCEIREITNRDAKVFNSANHLQGHRNAKVTYGLFYKNKLVQLMSFSKHNKYEWEIIRSCSILNNIVIGGASKLFKHFIREQNPSQIFSYCDFNKFNGKSYEAIGMSLIGYTEPDMKWILPNMKVVNRSPSKHKELKEASIGQIFGSGSKKYLWEK